MPNNVHRRSEGTNMSLSAEANSEEISLEVLEWLEHERMEHERRMQQLGCPF